MTAAVESILTQVQALSEDERAELTYALLTTLEPTEEGDDDAWEAELARRFAEIENGTAVGRPIEIVIAELRARFS